MTDVSRGHQKGADKIFELLEWCQQYGVEVVTLWLLSTDNLSRPASELEPLLRIIEETVRELVDGGWRINPVGALDLLPAETARALKDAGEVTAGRDGLLVNVAVGYGGRREIADAVRSLLQDHATRGTTIEELAGILDVEHIAEHLYTAGQPDPDLVIRTSGEQRLGGFLLWQSAQSEFYFCDAYWPAFRRVDFLRALRSYAARTPPLRRLAHPRQQVAHFGTSGHPVSAGTVIGGRAVRSRPTGKALEIFELRVLARRRDERRAGARPFAGRSRSRRHVCVRTRRPSGRPGESEWPHLHPAAARSRGPSATDPTAPRQAPAAPPAITRSRLACPALRRPA